MIEENGNKEEKKIEKEATSSATEENGVAADSKSEETNSTQEETQEETTIKDAGEQEEKIVPEPTAEVAEQTTAAETAEDISGTSDSTKETNTPMGLDPVEDKTDESEEENASVSSDETTVEVTPEPVVAQEAIEKKPAPKAKDSEGSHDIVAGESDEEHDDEEDSSEESGDDESNAERIQLPNLETIELAELLALAKKIRVDHSMQLVKPYLDEIKHHFFTKAKAERQEKLEAFVEGGGVEIDFEYSEPLRDEFKALLDDYRKERETYYNNLELELNANLKLREELIEELKGLLKSEEKFSETFNHFRELQEKWRSVGPVPRSASSDIWKTYHHHVENFYDYLRLNDDLRDMDFQKNLEHKQRLVKRAEELSLSEDIHAAFTELQGLHKEWKEESGPVAKEHREPIWEAFSEFTKKIHDKRHAHYDELKTEWEENLKLREKVCEKIEEAADAEINTHKDWQAKIKEVRGLADAFRSIGRVPKGKSTGTWNRFRDALLKFNTKKNEFYKELKDTYKANLSDRYNLIAKAEELKDSTDWRDGADALKKLQHDWKKLGPVGHSDNQKTWKKFREVCDQFFTRRKEHFAEQDKEYEDNYLAKEKLMAELEAFDLSKNTSEAVEKLKEFMSKWREIGFVPRSKMGIDKNWKQLVDLKFDQLKLSGKEKGEARFKNKVEILAARGGRELNREKDSIKREINDAQNELKTLEANIQMLTPTGNKPNPFIASVQESIENQKKKIEQLRGKLRLVKDAETTED